MATARRVYGHGAKRCRWRDTRTHSAITANGRLVTAKGPSYHFFSTFYIFFLHSFKFSTIGSRGFERETACTTVLSFTETRKHESCTVCKQHGGMYRFLCLQKKMHVDADLWQFLIRVSPLETRSHRIRCVIRFAWPVRSVVVAAYQTRFVRWPDAHKRTGFHKPQWNRAIPAQGFTAPDSDSTQ